MGKGQQGLVTRHVVLIPCQPEPALQAFAGETQVFVFYVSCLAGLCHWIADAVPCHYWQLCHLTAHVQLPQCLACVWMIVAAEQLHCLLAYKCSMGKSKLCEGQLCTMRSLVLTCNGQLGARLSHLRCYPLLESQLALVSFVAGLPPAVVPESAAVRYDIFIASSASSCEASQCLCNSDKLQLKHLGHSRQQPLLLQLLL